MSSIKNALIPLFDKSPLSPKSNLIRKDVQKLCSALSSMYFKRFLYFQNAKIIDAKVISENVYKAIHYNLLFEKSLNK